jgi:hypothetical protein
MTRVSVVISWHSRGSLSWALTEGYTGAVGHPRQSALD